MRKFCKVISVKYWVNKENKMIAISVIIPVYNADKYLSKCLDSILNQDLYNIEVICVNDGSKDSSLDILRDYNQRDKRLKIIDQKNAGAAYSRICVFCGFR